MKTFFPAPPLGRHSRPRPPSRSAVLAALFLTAACVGDDGPTGPVPIELHSNEVIVDWNVRAFETLVAHDGYSHPMNAVRVYAMVHAAQHDALNAIDPVYLPWAQDPNGPTDPVADPEAAAAAAAHRVLSVLFPEQQISLDEALADDLLHVTAGPPRDRGVEVGRWAADAVIARRAPDGSDTPEVGDYVPGVGPGRYQPTPPFGFAFAPGWALVHTFALTSPDQFRVDAPPALDSERYAVDFNEVKALGRQGSTVRTDDQTTYGNFWYEFSEIGWNRVARVVAQERGLGLHSTARLFALLNFAMSDAYVAGWDSKFHHDFWRPFTAIREASDDGNADTAPDAEWEPFLPTPPVQDYPSTHSALGDAAAEVLASVFGEGVTFTFTSTSAVPVEAARTFTGFSRAADENADSRVMAGLHFRFATEAGQALGRNIGRWTVETVLRSR